MICEKLKNYLDSRSVLYEIHWHPESYSSQETAAVEHVSGKIFAKTVIVKAGEQDVMIVLPADRMLDLPQVTRHLGETQVRIEDEGEVAELFPDCEIGAMPPIGKIYGLPAWVDASLLEKGEIYFNGGNHREVVRMTSGDFKRIAEARIGNFC